MQCHDDVRWGILQCDLCAPYKGPHARPKAPLQMCNAGAPSERVAIDVLGPLLVTRPKKSLFYRWWMRSLSGQKLYFCLIKHLPRFLTRLSPLGSLAMKHLFLFTRTKVEISEPHIFFEVCQRFFIMKARTTPLHSRSNGTVERMNRILL